MKKIDTSLHKKTIHSAHKHVERVDLCVEFKFNPSKMNSTERYIKMASECFDINDVTPLECKNKTGHISKDEMNTEHFIVNGITITGYENDSPFYLMLKSNMFTLVSNFFRTVHGSGGESINNERNDLPFDVRERIIDKNASIMPLLPGLTGMHKAEPFHTKTGLNEKKINQKDYFKPEFSRAFYNNHTKENLSNGIYVFPFIDILGSSGRMCNYCLLSVDHVIATFAIVNWKKEKFIIKPHDITNNTQGGMKVVSSSFRKTFFLMNEEIVIRLIDKMIKSGANVFPLCETDKVNFEMEKWPETVKKWNSIKGAVSGTTKSSLDKDYRCKWFMNIEYTLFKKNIYNKIVTLPLRRRVIKNKQGEEEEEAVITHQFTNIYDIEEYLKHKIDEKIQDENVVMSLSEMKLMEEKELSQKSTFTFKNE